MSTAELILIDTCIWVPHFNRPQSAIKRSVDALIDENRAALIGPVLAEVLTGFRRDAEADWVASALRGLPYLDVTRADWRTAARLNRMLAAQGNRLPLTDLALAAVALRHGCALWTTDPHFDLLPSLKRFRP